MRNQRALQGRFQHIQGVFLLRHWLTDTMDPVRLTDKRLVDDPGNLPFAERPGIVLR